MLLIKCVLHLKIINKTIYFQTICKKREVREDNSSSFCSQDTDFGDWEGKWQLVHAPGETGVTRRHAPAQLLVADILHPRLLSVKSDRKQRKWRRIGGGGVKKTRKKKKPVWLQTSPRGCYDALSGKTRTNRYTRINSSSELQDLWVGGERKNKKKETNAPQQYSWIIFPLFFF